MHPNKETTLLLYEASKRFRSVDSIPELLTCLMEILRKFLGTDLTSIWLLNKPQKVLTCVSAEGSGKEKLRKRKVKLGEGLLGKLVQSQRELWITDDDDPENLLSKFSREWGIKISFLGCAPLHAREELVGATFISHCTPYREDKPTKNMNFFRKLASSAALALEDLYNRERLAKRIRDLTTLSEVGVELTASLDLGKVLKTVVNNIMGHFIVEEVAILLLDEKKNHLVPAEYHGLPESVLDLDFHSEGELAKALNQVKAPILSYELDDLSLSLEEEKRLEGLKASVLLPIFVQEELLGLITLGEKLTHEPYDESEIEFLSTIANQAGIAIKNATLFQAEKKAKELSLLLEISKEITATLDLDRVLSAFVNLASQVIEYDRAAVGLIQKDSLRIIAISGQEKVKRKTPDISLLEKLLFWVSEGKRSIYVSSLGGEIQAENEETKERVKDYFDISQMKSFLVIPLMDEEGVLGAAVMESQAPSFLTESNLEVVEILSNQLTVAVRNVQLYQQIPLARLIHPIAAKKRTLFRIPRRKLSTIVAGAVLILIFLIFWRSELKITCPLEIWPQRTYTVTAEVGGIIQEVLVGEGEVVQLDQPLATLYNEHINSRLNEVEVWLKTSQGNARSLFAANRTSQYQMEKNQISKLEAELSLLKTLSEKTKIVSPISGTILTPRLKERIGEYLEKGDFFCQVADLNKMQTEIQFPSKDIHLAKENQKIKLLVSAFPEKTFWGTAEKVSPTANYLENRKTFLVMGKIENTDGLLRPGMTGHAKVYCGKRSLAYTIFRKPARLFRELAWRVLGL